MNREHFFTCCRAIMPECQVESIGKEGFDVHDPVSDYYIGCSSGDRGLLMWNFGDRIKIDDVWIRNGDWVEVSTEEEVFKYLKKFKEIRHEIKAND